MSYNDGKCLVFTDKEVRTLKRRIAIKSPSALLYSDEIEALLYRLECAEAYIEVLDVAEEHQDWNEMRKRNDAWRASKDSETPEEETYSGQCNHGYPFGQPCKECGR